MSMTQAVDTTPQIYAAMSAVMRELDAIGKDKRNQQQGFNYRGIDDVYNALHPLLAKHGIICTPDVLDKAREERTNAKGTVLAFTTLRIRYTFWAGDGSSVACTVEGEGMDSGDKSSNKAMAVAHKYALLQTFCIPTQDMPDPDAEVHAVAPRLARTPSDDPDQLVTHYKARMVECDNLASLKALYSTACRAIQPFDSDEHMQVLVATKDAMKAKLEGVSA
jgi:hypothetical protein